MPQIPTVLLVDDSPCDRMIVCRELQRELGEVRFVEVTDAGAFEQVMTDAEFDLVVTDYQIQWTDGLQVLHRIRSFDPDCPVLMFTVNGNEEIALTAMKAGLDDYILKNPDSIRRLGSAARAALEHADVRRRASQMEQRFCGLLEHLNVGVFRRTTDGVIVEANDAAAAILEVAPEDVTGFNLIDYLSDFAVTAITGSERELLGQPANGRRTWLTVCEHSTVGLDGEQWIDGLIEDITARKHAEVDVEVLQEEVAHTERINITAEMGAGIAHQLAQLLQIMSSFAGVTQDHLKKEKPVTDDVLQWLQNIENLAEQAGKVIRSLSDFNEHRPHSPASTDIGELINSTMEMLAAYLRHRDIRVTVDSAEGLVLEADTVQLRQVIMNLIKASVASLSVRDHDRALVITANRVPSGIRVSISHNGPQIPDQQMQRMFEPWVSRHEEHPGIGLSISARIIEAHRGRISARNEADGVTFCLELPVRTPVSGDSESSAET